jgi:Putative peptidoglycan binding domain
MKKILPFLFVGLLAFTCVAQAASSFNRDLYFGMQKDADVANLQEFLTGKGLYSGPVNGNFFSMTLKAVEAFQAEQGIDPPAGYFGPATREKVNGLLSANVTGASVPSAISAMQTRLQMLLQQVAALQKQLQTLQAARPPVQAPAVQQNTTTTPSVTTSSAAVILQSPTSTMQTSQYQTPQPAQSTQAGFVSVMLGSDSACGSFSGGPAANRSRMVVDNVSCLKFSADPSGREIHIKSITLNFAGTALSGAGAFGVTLIDPQTQTAYDGSTEQSCVPVNGTCSATFNFVGTPINAGQTKGIVARINSANFSNSIGEFDGLDITLNTRNDISWNDGVTTSGLPSDVGLPVLLTHVDYQ